jgi:hypothetical protein
MTIRSWTAISGARMAVLAACAATLVAGSALAADLSGLQAWVGKYPSDRIGGRRFFDYPGLRAEMRKAMGEQAYRALQQIRGPEGVVVRVGDHVAAWHCMAHDCGDKNTTTIARLAKGDVVVCVQLAPQQAARRWYIPGRAPLDERGGGCPFDAAEIGAAIQRLGL